MNFYNPYLYSIPSTFTAPRLGIFSRLFGSGGLKFGSILSGTQRALGFVNQVIPVVKQVQPMVKNAKTMFRVMNEFKKTDNSSINFNQQNEVINSEQQNYKSTNINTNNQHTISKTSNNNSGPTFFI